jgi:DNA repair photolyase
VGVLAHPMMPLINDSEKSIEAVCEAAVANGASSFSASPLFLKPCAQRVFFPFLEQHFSLLLQRYKERYQANAYLKGHYPEMIRERVQKVLSRHKWRQREVVEWPVDDQLDLFA